MFRLVADSQPFSIADFFATSLKLVSGLRISPSSVEHGVELENCSREAETPRWMELADEGHLMN